MAPVRRTLVAVWMGVGLSEVAKMEGLEDRISIGPSSGGASSTAVAVVVGSSGTWASHGSVVVWLLWAETERKMVVGRGLQRKLREEREMGRGEKVRREEQD